MRALVLGGYGAVGTRVVAELRRDGHEAISAGRDPTRAERVVDLRDGTSYSKVLEEGVEVVVNASGREDPDLAGMAADQGAGFVDITATAEYIARLEHLNPPAPVLLSVGLTPGLTNLLAAAVHDRVAGPIDLVVLLGAGERHGAAALAWSYGLLGRRFRDPAGEGQIRNYTRSRMFDLPGYGRRRVYRADLSDQHTLSRDLGVPVRTYFGLDSRTATGALAVLAWVPGASRLPRGVHFPGTDRWLALARGRDQMRWAHGRGQSQATAVVTATAARAVGALPAGVHHLHHVLTLADVPSDRGINLGTTTEQGLGRGGST